MAKTQEEIDADTAAAEAAQAEEKEQADAEFEAELEGLSDEEKAAKIAEKEAKDSDKGIDYKALAEQERVARKKAEDALAAKRFQASKKRKEEEGDEEDDDLEDDKPVTRKDLLKLQSEQEQRTAKVVQATAAKEIAKRLAGSDEQAEYVLEIFKNRTFPAHLSLEEQVEEAFVISNKKKLIGERNEALRGLRNKDNVNKNGASGHKDTPVGTEPKLSPADASAIKSSGFVWNGTSRQYEKKLPNGNILVRDPQTKRVTLRKA